MFKPIIISNLQKSGYLCLTYYNHSNRGPIDRKPIKMQNGRSFWTMLEFLFQFSTWQPQLKYLYFWEVSHCIGFYGVRIDDFLTLWLKSQISVINICFVDGTLPNEQMLYLHGWVLPA